MNPRLFYILSFLVVFHAELRIFDSTTSNSPIIPYAPSSFGSPSYLVISSEILITSAKSCKVKISSQSKVTVIKSDLCPPEDLALSAQEQGSKLVILPLGTDSILFPSNYSKSTEVKIPVISINKKDLSKLIQGTKIFFSHDLKQKEIVEIICFLTGNFDLDFKVLKEVKDVVDSLKIDKVELKIGVSYLSEKSELIKDCSKDCLLKDHRYYCRPSTSSLTGKENLELSLKISSYQRSINYFPSKSLEKILKSLETCKKDSICLNDSFYSFKEIPLSDSPPFFPFLLLNSQPILWLPLLSQAISLSLQSNFNIPSKISKKRFLTIENCERCQILTQDDECPSECSDCFSLCNPQVWCSAGCKKSDWTEGICSVDCTEDCFQQCENQRCSNECPNKVFSEGKCPVQCSEQCFKKCDKQKFCSPGCEYEDLAAGVEKYCTEQCKQWVKSGCYQECGPIEGCRSRCSKKCCKAQDDESEENEKKEENSKVVVPVVVVVIVVFLIAVIAFFAYRKKCWRKEKCEFPDSPESKDCKKVEFGNENFFRSNESHDIENSCGASIGLAGKSGKDEQGNHIIRPFEFRRIGDFVGESICSVDLCGFAADDLVSKMPCGHIYHPQCITRWLENPQSEKKCPNCQSDLRVVRILLK